jgi:DNA-directed RNA polymerase subunit N (RpoN/RPB10)
MWIPSSDKEEVDFKPTKLLCLSCKSIVSSKYSGHFCSCSCGKLAIDQTECYTRILGNKQDYAEVLDEQS